MKSIKSNKINYSMNCFKWVFFSHLFAEPRQNYKTMNPSFVQLPFEDNLYRRI